jgi:adenylate cyclase class 2
MKTEIEAKWLDVDKEEIRKKLKQAGAKQIHPERLMTRRNFDYPDGRLEKISGWVRVRDEANKVTLSYKQVDDRSIHGTKEVDAIVNDADVACDFLESIGLEQKSFQETKRESWILDSVEI